jgi:hypothetical protein
MELIAAGFVGGTIGILFFSWIVEGFAFKSREPGERAMLTVGMTFAVFAILAAIAFADDEPLGVLTGVFYLPGAVIGYFWFRKRYAKKWAPDISDVFE